MQTISAGKHTIYIPTTESPCEMWKGYFTSLKKIVGQENAKLIWLVTWQQNGAVSCTTNADFNRWLAGNSIDVSSAATRAVADLSKVGQNILGLGKRITGILSVGLPIVLAIALILVLIMVYNSTRKTGRISLARSLDPKALLPAKNFTK